MSIIKTKISEKPKTYWIAKGFIKLFDGLVILLTLGFYWSDFEYKFTKWNTIGFSAKQSRFFVVWEEDISKYDYMETAWTKKEVEGVKKYDWANWNKTGSFKQSGFKWKVVSEHKNKEEARIVCEGLNTKSAKI